MAFKDILYPIEEKEEIVPDGYKIKASAVFNLEDLYLEMQRWFLHMGYDWKETRYLASDLANGQRLTEITWKCTRVLDEYLYYEFDLHMKATVGEVEVTVEDAKKKMNKGSIEFRFKGMLKKNKGVWGETGIKHLMGLFYDRMLIRGRIHGYSDALKTESGRFFGEIKSYLQIA